MPPKRKGATAEDEIEAPPAKITKGNKEVDKPWDQVWDTVCIYTREEYNRRVLRSLDDCTEMLMVPDNFQEIISKNEENFPAFEVKLKEYIPYMKIGYEAFYRE